MVDETVALATVDETLFLLGCSVSAIDETIASGSREEALQGKLEKLIVQSCPIMHHQKNLKKAVNLLEIEFRKIKMEMLQLRRISLLPDALIHFVHLLEVADQYFDFKKIAKQANDFKSALTGEVVFDTLFADQQLKSKFSQIGEREISKIAREIHWELCDEQYGTDSASSLPIDWIYKLVFQAREKGYVMDQEPTAELEKMMKSEPHDYDEYFVINPLPVKCTEKSTEEARNKYSQLVSKMHSEYKEAVDEKRKFKVFDEKLTFATTPASRRKRKFVMTDGKNRMALRENRMRATPSNFGGWA